MNTKFLVLTSFLIALLCHVFIFNFCTLLFPIDPVALKPKFFFLGPILQQSDVDQSPPEDAPDKNGLTVANNFGHEKTVLKNIHYEIADPEKNPFAIKTIHKPLAAQTSGGANKVLIKSMFPSLSDEKQSKEAGPEDPGKELNIQPYRPLRSRLP